MISEIDPCKNEKCGDCTIVITPPCICQICKFNQDCGEKPKYSCDKFEVKRYLRKVYRKGGKNGRNRRNKRGRTEKEKRKIVWRPVGGVGIGSKHDSK